MTGAVLGSPCYMAPEQARGLKQLDGRTDLYSVGTLMFECLTGRVPFEGDNFNDLMFKIVLAPRPDPLEIKPDLDPVLASVASKALCVDPQDRFQSAEEFRRALVSWLESKGLPSVRPPELRRGVRATPMGSGATRARTPGRTPGTPAALDAPGAHAEGPSSEASAARPVGWREATMRIEGSTETPLASSSATPQAAQPPVPSPKRGSGLLWTAGIAVVLLAAGGGVFVGRSKSHAASPPVAHEAPAPAPPEVQRPTAPAPAVEATITSSAIAPSSASAALAPPPAPVLVSGETAPAKAAAGARTPVAVPSQKGKTIAAQKPASGSAPPPAPEPPAPADSAPPPPVATSAKPVSTVEGREIRTGL
jgi:serine/threonine-protein kinase